MTVVLASIALARSGPDEARRLYERALEAAEAIPGPPLSTTGDLHVGLAEVLVEQGELGGGRGAPAGGGGARRAASLIENRHRAHVARAALLRARGDLDGAVAMLDEAEPLFLPGYFPDVRPIPALRARVRIAQGRLADAARWASERGVDAGRRATYLDEFDQLTLARLLVAERRRPRRRRRPDDAHRGGGRGARASRQRRGRARRTGSRAAREGRPRRGARRRWARPCALAVPAGWRRLFLDEGAPMVELLRAAATEDDLAATVLASDARDEPPVPAAPSEGLSERELEVLRLLATELTGPEIAQRLYVSVNTLRTHTKHIFTKLDVNTRRAAVRRAAERAPPLTRITTPVTSPCDVGSPRRFLASWTSPDTPPGHQSRSRS